MMSDTVRSARYHEKEKYESYRYQRKQRKMRRRDRRNAREKKRRHARLVKKYGESVTGPCTRKIRYKSKSGALTYIRNNHEPIDLYVYKCPYCGGWHVTSHPIGGETGINGTYVPQDMV